MSTTTEKLKQTIATTADTVKDKARSAQADVAAHAAGTVAALRDGAAAHLDDARDALSESGDRLADTLQRAAEDQPEGALQTRVMAAAASGLATVSDSLRDRSLAEMAADLKALARRHPAVFAAGAAVAGFALARILRSAAQDSAARTIDAPRGTGTRT